MDTDLERNRHGDITPAQRDALVAASRIRGDVATAIVPVVLATIYVAAAWSSPWGAAVAAVILGLGAAWRIRAVVGASRRIEQDLQAGVVAHDRGTVAWRGGDYAATIEGAAPFEIKDVALLPGAYQFHYLPRSGRILSAERRSGVLDSERAILQALAQAVPFSHDALAMNRQGRFAAGQFVLVGRPYSGNLIVSAICFGVVIFQMWPYIVGEQTGLSESPNAVLFPLLTIVGLLTSLPLLIDWFRGRVDTIDGPVTRTVKSSGRTTLYLLIIGKETFRVSKAVHHALVEGLSYRAYVLRRTRVLVAIEPVDLVGYPIDAFQV